MKIPTFNRIIQLNVVFTVFMSVLVGSIFYVDNQFFNAEATGFEWQEFIQIRKTTHVENTPVDFDLPKQEFFEISPYDFSLNAITLAKFRYPQLDGSGTRVSVKEELFDTSSIDLKSRIRLNGQQSPNIDQHATSIAVQIAGAGNTDRTGLGVAPAALLSGSSFYNLMPDETSIFRSQGIYVQNHSYGTKIENEYGELAAAYDAQVYELKELVHVFSSGNSGLEGAENGRYAGITGFANLTGNFKMSKNTLSVGALDATEQVIDRSSKGPAYDGRVKPELVAYALNGTSDAAALVSGTALLLQQLYKEKTGNIPESALVRAALIAGATDVYLPEIDFATGYGSLNASESLDILDAGNFVEAKVSLEDAFRHTISIPSGATQLRLALSWTDLPAEVGAGSALMNDLDLKLMTPSGDKLLPWVLDTEADAQRLEATATRAQDHLNNNELITLKDLEPGEYTIEVSASSLQSATQSFVFAYTFSQSESFEWEYPRATDALVTNDEFYVRWDSTRSQSTADLQININDAGWQTISAGIDLNKGYELVDFAGISGVVKLRMLSGETIFETETFTVSPELTPKVEFNCDEEFMLSWPQVPKASAYEITHFEEGVLKRVDVVEDTLYVFSKRQFDGSLFSVRPYFGENPGVKGVTIDYTQQGVSCYFVNFFGFLDDSPAARLSLELSTIIGVREVRFRQSINNEVAVLKRFESPFTGLSFDFSDSSLPGGNVIYDALIILDDGSEIQTNAVNFFLPFDNDLYVYPNPLRRGDELKLVSRGDDLKLLVYDMQGRQVFEEVLLRINDRLELPFESSGIYLIEVFRNDKPIAVKKIVVY